MKYDTVLFHQILNEVLVIRHKNAMFTTLFNNDFIQKAKFVSLAIPNLTVQYFVAK